MPYLCGLWRFANAYSIIFWRGDWFSEAPKMQCDWMVYILDWINSFHVYAFTLVSGYIFAYKKNKGDYNDLVCFVKTKVKRLLIPYIFVMLIWVVPISEIFFKCDIEVIVKNYFWGINPSQLWFLLMLFWVFLISWILYYIFKKKILGCACAMGFYLLGFIGGGWIPNVFCILTACRYVIFFYLGIQIRICHENGEKAKTERIPWWNWCILDALFFAMSQIMMETNYLHYLLEFFSNIIGAIMAFYVLQKIADWSKWYDKKSFTNLSKCMMPIYLFHQQIIYFVISALNGKVHPVLNAFANFTISLFVSWLISWLLLKCKITKFLIGQK